jgi:uroporphyrinogen-III synthase
VTNDLPLSRLKIVVTRPRDQAAHLAQSIEQAGGIPLLFPLLDITAVQNTETLHEQIARLAQFNLAIFISPNAVHYGISAIRAAGELPPYIKIATVGQGSAKALRESGIADVIAPTERFDSEGLLALPELQNVAGWLLADTLKARGATVEYATCYQRSKPQQDAGVLLTATPDAITVTSSEALRYLWQMLDIHAQASLRDIPLFVPHARIAELALQQGWQQVQVTASGDDGLLSALIEWTRRKAEKK